MDNPYFDQALMPEVSNDLDERLIPVDQKTQLYSMTTSKIADVQDGQKTKENQ